jgi:enediyne biosynthesis protein E4
MLNSRPTSFMKNLLQTPSKATAIWVVICVVAAAAVLGAVLQRYSVFSRAGARASMPDIFIDASEASGIHFVHANGMKGEYYFAEIIGSGVALLDYDNDGRLDILALDGTPLGEAAASEAGSRCSARLFHNELTVSESGARTLTFNDVTESSGLCSRGYGMGVAIGDYDNDGYPDVFITHFAAPNQLFHNNGDGTFSDVTDKAGVAGSGRWGASVSFFDYDRDGLLDLYVANYVNYSVGDKRKCNNYTSARDYCAPVTYPPVPGILYRNLGDGTFEDVSIKSGITQTYGNGLGVVAADLNGDGWPDLFVANDGNPNQLWINQKNGTFRNEAFERGVAVSVDGAAEAGMGVDIADTGGTGNEDIFVTHLTHEKATLYRNLGQGGQFEDVSSVAGLYVATTPFTGFGTVFLDYDNDGWPDIVIANGAVHVIEEEVRAHDPLPLHQTKQLLRNLGNGRFEDVSGKAGSAFALSEVGRGLAAGDLDNDGGVDFVVANNNGRLRIFLNKAAAPRPWVGLRVLTGKRYAYGAKVEIRRKGAHTLWRRVHSDGSYLSASDPRLVVGLGDASQIDSLIVHWPDGTEERFPPPSLRTYTTISQGSGTRVATP